MTLHRDGDAPDLPDLPRDTADRVLRRAIELESAMGEVVSGEQLKDIARQIDLDPHYLRMALAEIEAAEIGPAPAHPAAPGSRDVRVRAAFDRTASAIATMLAAGMLGMLTGVGVGAAWSRPAGDAAFMAGAAVFALAIALMLVSTMLMPFAGMRLWDKTAAPTAAPRIGDRSE
jgi:hypothetical protein